MLGRILSPFTRLPFALVVALTAAVPTSSRLLAVPPAPSAEFTQPQSPTKPEPFPVRLLDQGWFDRNLKGYYLPEGFRMEIVLDAPDVINPVGMTFAPDGSLFVLEWLPDPVTGGKWFEVKETFRYKDGTTRQVATMKKFTSDLVKHFKYDARTGKFGPPTPIISDMLPSSVLYHEGYLYLSGRGTVRRWKQSREGGPWDITETIAQGFCGFHHHQVSGMTIGNDGWLYLTSGDDDNYVEGSDGSRATVLRTGAIFRCRPDGSQMETYSLGYRNPYRDLAYDDKFNWFHADNDNEDGSKFMGCRIMHVAEGADFGWRLMYGARCCRPDVARVSVAGEVPGKVAPMIKTGRGSPAGLLIYHDTRIPEQYRGLLYYPDVYRKLVRAYKTVPDGSTFKITNEFEFLKSDDPLFRPCQMVTGPDGAIYVCDWRTDSGGAGKLSGDGIHGRIYRIRWEGTQDDPGLKLRPMNSWVKIQKLDDQKLVDALGSPDLTDRVVARKELVRRGAKSRDLVLQRFVSGKLDGAGRLPAIGVLQSYWDSDVEDLFRLLLRDESPDVRRLAVEGLGRNAKPKDSRAFDALVRALGDFDPAVRRAAALGLGRLGADGTADVLVNALRFDENPDPFLKDAYIRGLEALGKPGIDAVLTLAESGDRELNQALDIFIAFRSRPAALALPRLLTNPHTSMEQRVALVTSFNNYQLDPPISLAPLADFLSRRPDEAPEVVSAALEAFAFSSEGLASPQASQFVVSLLSRTDETVRLAAIRAVEAARLTAASPKLLEMIADRSLPTPERIAVVKALRVMAERRAIAPMQAIMKGEHPATLKVEALRTLAALNVVAARTAAEGLLDQPDPDLLAEAVAVLGTTKPGAKLIGERYVTKKLPRDMFLQVTDALKRFSADDASIAKLQAEVLKGGLLLSLEPGQIEKVRKLVATKGNAQRGKELYLSTNVLACAKCHRMEGVGGSTGPDLSRVWDTHTIEKILESIVDPSKEIKEGFQTYRVVTVDEQILSGLKVTETGKEVVLRDANGRDIRVAKEDIDSIKPEKLSLMPDNVVSQLSYEQFIDLLAFLKSRSAQESLRGMVVEFGVAGPFASGVASSRPEIDSSSGTKWLPVFADPNGSADLAPMFKSKTGGVYARTFVYAGKAQKATVSLLTENPVRVWINGSSVFTRAVVKAKGSVEGETLGVSLKPGWNSVLVKLAGEGKSRRLGIRFSGEDLRTSAVPEPVAATPGTNTQ